MFTIKMAFLLHSSELNDITCLYCSVTVVMKICLSTMVIQ